MVSAVSRHRLRRLLRAALPILGVLAWSQHALAACDDLLPGPEAGNRPPRLVTSEDILRLRDIGTPDSSIVDAASPLALSPDGTQLAFFLNRADPDDNAACRALVVVKLDAGSHAVPQPRVLDRGGELITPEVGVRGVMFGLGLAAVVTPAWSPDGQWLAYLRRDRGHTQVWRVRSDGSGAQQVTHATVDVDGVAWSSDGRHILYRVREGQVEAARAIDLEGRGGWHYDARIAPFVGPRPLVSAALARQTHTIDPDTGLVAKAVGADEGRLAPEPDLPEVKGPQGSRAWTRPSSANPASPLQLLVTDKSGKTVICSLGSEPGRLVRFWWDGHGKSLLILRREGWRNGQMGLLRWTPGNGMPRRILLTDDVLLGCILGMGSATGALVCTSENAVTPRHIVSIDLRGGRQRMVYDPNPEFRALRLGKVERLRWRNDVGLPAWGDLVLPPDYHGEEKLPLVIVQYHSDGFLRGGTGDEVPIHAFAARGFAVLSLELPVSIGTDNPDLHNWEAINAAGIKDWAERKSLFSSTMIGVQMVIARGIVDPKRIGITGLSDGASATRFALVNSRLFAAAAISTCCTDTRSMMINGGIGFADAMRREGYPPSITDHIDFWAPYSMTLAAHRMDRPLLMQLADHELNLSLETFTALREAGQPVDMYVYPDEYHIKWQPAHRQAVYNRNLDWFSFWLQGKEDPSSTKAEEYRRWEEMKRKLGVAAATSSAQPSP